MHHDAEPQAAQDGELGVYMVRNHGNAPSHWCDGGAFYPVLGAVELPARSRYTTTAEDRMSEQQSAADQSLAQQTSPYGYAYWEWVAREDPEHAGARISLSELSVGDGK